MPRVIARALSQIAVFTAAIVILSATPAAAQADPPRQFYLALGDSIAYGYQASKHRAGLPPSAFNTGYVDVFAEHLRQIQPAIAVVNYSCPGETTKSFIKGPCLWSTFGEQLHDPFLGSQLDAAVEFLSAHPGAVSPITLTLWGNDLREFTDSCKNLACVQNRAPAFIALFSERLAKILRRLRDEAPDAEIVTEPPLTMGCSIENFFSSE